MTAPRLTQFAKSAGCAAKIAPRGIGELLKFIPRPADPDLLVGTETHDDAGVYRLTDDIALVQTVDFFPPIVDDPFAFGQIAAANALSDVYAMGGVPKTALNLVAFPVTELPLEILGTVLAGGADRCALAGAAVVGGHSIRDAGIKFGLAVTGVVHPQRILTNAGARPGDVLVLTKALGTGYATTAAKNDRCPADVLAAAVASMSQLNRAARDLMLEHGAHAATDVTGFGLVGHGYEMALGSGVTLRFRAADLPRLPGIEPLVTVENRTRASKTNSEYVGERLTVEAGVEDVARELFVDAQTSGGLLVSLPADRADGFLRAAHAAGLSATRLIADVLPAGDAGPRIVLA